MGDFLGEESVRLVGRLGRVERLNNEDLVIERANRTGFEFDSVNARASLDATVSAIAGVGQGAPLAMLKVLTTFGRFASMIQRDAPPQEGDWFLLELEPRSKRSGPLAWASVLGPRGYDENRPLVLRGATWLFHEDEPPLRPLSATVAGERVLAQAIAAACDFPKEAIGRLVDARKLLSARVAPHHAVVRDVGQASFVSLRDSGNAEIVHLDAGWPISWNQKTSPKKPPTITVVAAPVILSHWDWDHLHGYHVVPDLAGSHWIVPVQKLGPGAKRVAAQLARGGRLYGLATQKLTAGPFVVGRCKGMKGSSNNTGLAVRVTLDSGKQLLFVGDADYDVLPLGLQGPSDFLVVTHHGARFAGAAATVKTIDARGVVSVGFKNGYGHPSSHAINAHSSAGWSLRYTCKWGTSRRGARQLGP